MLLWILRSSLVLSALICIGIFCVEILNRGHKKNTEPKWLNIWSLTTIIASIFRLLLLFAFTIPTICTIFNLIYYPPHIAINVFLTFYQISRLQYCFKQNYSKYCFIFLYFIGVLIICVIYSLRLSTYEVISMGKNGCYIQRDESYAYILSISIFTYYIWDIFIIILYIYKILNLQTYAEEATHTKISDVKKINTFLRKILLLTICIEIITFVCATMAQMSAGSNILYIYSSIEIVIIVLLLFLMLEHNIKVYHKVIHFLTSVNICCCCKKFVYSTMLTQHKNNQQVISVEMSTQPAAGTSTKMSAPQITDKQSEVCRQ
eukprot:297513_1